MKQKTFITLLLLVLILGGASLLVRHHRSGAWQQQGTMSGAKVLGDFPLNDVTQISITAGSDSVHLLKRNDRWIVKEKQYPADFGQVGRLLRTLWDLKAVQDLNAGPTQLARLQLVEPGKDVKDAGSSVELKDAQDKRIAALLAGKSFMKTEPGVPGEGFPAGRYVMALDGKSRVVLVSDPLNEITTKPDSWLDHAFVHIDHIKSVSLSGTKFGMQWKIQRESENGEWHFADAKPDEKFDPSKLPNFASTLGSPAFSDVLPPDTKPESRGLDKTVTIVAETFDGFTYTIKAGTLADDKYPITVSVTANIEQTRKPDAKEKPEDKKRLDDEFAAKKKQLEQELADAKKLEGRIFLVPKYTIDSLLKERSSFIAKPTPAPAPSATPTPGVSVTTPPVAAPPAGRSSSTPSSHTPGKK